MISDTSKTLLKNVIKHTDTHNRIVEETEMWSSYASQRERKHQDKRHRGYSPESRGIQSTVYQVPRAHMDRELSVSEPVHDAIYWKRKLQEMEEKDPDRWGHAGYKELYPEQFISDTDSSSSSSSDVDRKRSKCKRKRVEKSHKSKKKHRHKEKKQKKHKSRKESSDCQWIVRNVDGETKH
ncbi:hypothetical protein LSH36_272g01004 [Paralvinella palmiformis]|uniref:Uncharacterized protein n=1 Tax=Paralvinella palmiformis TaxID=53620 RepID=A0AAD9N4S6_9ANNE|nr:hypothetical protein LSH36_272g01004 [Paralvinella palmiformis]